MFSKQAGGSGTNRPSSCCSTPQAACRKRSRTWVRRTRARTWQLPLRELRHLERLVSPRNPGLGPGTGKQKPERAWMLHRWMRRGLREKAHEGTAQQTDPVRKAPDLGQASDGRRRTEHSPRWMRWTPGDRKHWRANGTRTQRLSSPSVSSSGLRTGGTVRSGLQTASLASQQRARTGITT